MRQSTRQRILQEAELLFARHGYASTSVREITEAADANLAAVNYHFGSKENLLIELLDRVVAPINEQRLELLDEMEAKGAPEVDEVLTAFLLPDLQVLHELRDRDPDLPRFVSRMYSEGSDLMTQVIGRQFAETQRRFLTAFERVLPELAREEIAWRLHCLVGIILYLFADMEIAGIGSMVRPDPKRNLDRLLTVTVPMMTAPMERTEGP